jgi:hypothetical protein
MFRKLGSFLLEDFLMIQIGLKYDLFISDRFREFFGLHLFLDCGTGD